VMAPSQVVESKDLPPEVLAHAAAFARADALPAAAPAGSFSAAPVALPAAPAMAGSVPLTDSSSQGPTSGRVAEPLTAATLVGAAGHTWLADLRDLARAQLQAGQADVWEGLTQDFERSLIETALEVTHQRRIEAAQRLGIGRNTITRKIQELGMDNKPRRG
jgi:two-component system, NtrC family, nitrogen regulation response regulator GlnG